MAEADSQADVRMEDQDQESAPGPGTEPGSAEPKEVSEAKNQLLTSCTALVQQYGSPTAYLTQVLESEAAAQGFVTWLVDTFPEAEDVLYSQDESLPKVTEENRAGTLPLVVHVATLGWSALSSLKPPCGPDLSKKLWEQYLTEGFLTAEAPLLVSQSEHSTAVHPALTSPWTPAADSKGLRPFSLGNVKGFARASALQMLLFRAMDLGIDLKTLMPDFWSSVRKVYVHCMPITNRLDEAMQNMKLSARGSLRQANNTIQCVVMIQNLCARGGLTDASHFIRRWNAMAAKSFQIVGRKQMALKQLFENTPQESMTCMLFL